MEEQHQTMTKAKSIRRQQQSRAAADLYPQLPQDIQRAVDAAKEKGASSWLTTLPIDEHGFALHKGAFRDAICLRYGWRPPRLATECVCGNVITVDHALSCPRGGLPTLRHNKIRDLTVQLLSETCPNVSIELVLQPLTGESLTYLTANAEEGARLDVRADGFWGDRHQSAFFDVRVFNPLAPSNRRLTPTSCYRQHEREKRRAYDQRVREIEHGTFTPLVFSAAGGMGNAATITYRRLAYLLATKRSQSYSRTMGWLRCRISFSLLRSAITCLRGARSTIGHPARPLCVIDANLDLATSEGRVPNY